MTAGNSAAASRGQHTPSVLFHFALFFLTNRSVAEGINNQNQRGSGASSELPPHSTTSCWEERGRGGEREQGGQGGGKKEGRQEGERKEATHHADFEGIEKVKGQGGHQVDDEPGGQVVDADLAGIKDHLT